MSTFLSVWSTRSSWAWLTSCWKAWTFATTVSTCSWLAFGSSWTAFAWAVSSARRSAYAAFAASNCLTLFGVLPSVLTGFVNWFNASFKTLKSALSWRAAWASCKDFNWLAKFCVIASMSASVASPSFKTLPPFCRAAWANLICSLRAWTLAGVFWLKSVAFRVLTRLARLSDWVMSGVWSARLTKVSGKATWRAIIPVIFEVNWSISDWLTAPLAWRLVIASTRAW